MTSRQLYEGVLIELNKENAPNILLEDFNYFANKAINNYINKRYNIYDVNQLTTDDLRVLKATALLTPEQVKDYSGLTMAGDDHMATYEVVMPSDYLHILNCICVYKVNKTYKCYNKGDTWRAPATRLTADMYSLVLDNFWNKPTYRRPYYYIHNVNVSNFVPTNPYEKENEGTFIQRLPKYNYYDTNLSSTVINPENSSLLNGSSNGFSYTFPINFESEDGSIQGTFIELDIDLSYPHRLYFYYNNTYYSLDLENGSSLAVDRNRIIVEYVFDYEPLNALSATVLKRNGLYIIYFSSSDNSNNNDSGDSGGDNSPSTTPSTISLEVGSDVNTVSYGGGQLRLGTDCNTLSNTSKLNLNTKNPSSGSFSSHFKYGTENSSTEYEYGDDAFGNKIVLGEGLPRTIDILNNNGTEQVSNIERGQGLRYGNVSQVRLEIRYGTDNLVFELKLVYVDYIKAPQNIRLTQQEIDLTEDTSQMLEYPDYVCQEIINELVHLVMENISDLRLQTHPVVTLSIANPAQALAPLAQGLSAQ